MLLPPLCTQQDYCQLADQVGLKVFSPPLDISDNVAKTWSGHPHVISLLHANTLQGHLLVIGSEAISLGIRFLTRSRRYRLSSIFSCDAPRLCERLIPLCSHGVREAVRIRGEIIVKASKFYIINFIAQGSAP